jgi:hypothetical protein
MAHPLPNPFELAQTSARFPAIPKSILFLLEHVSHVQFDYGATTFD